MADTQSKWQTEELATGFLEGVRGAIPAAALQLELIDHIIASWRPKPRRILDLGCGDGALGRFLLEQYPKVRVVFADFSEPMLDAAKKRLEGRPRASVVKADFASPAWRGAVVDTAPFDAVVSGFAIHHQPDARKKALYAEVFTLLTPGGVFLNLEHVASATPVVGRLFDEYFIDCLYRFHQSKDPAKTRQEVADVYYNRPDKAENLLAPIEDQCRWLRDIGFTDVDFFFKTLELALFGGRKPGASAR